MIIIFSFSNAKENSVDLFSYFVRSSSLLEVTDCTYVDLSWYFVWSSANKSYFVFKSKEYVLILEKNSIYNYKAR